MSMYRWLYLVGGFALVAAIAILMTARRAETHLSIEGDAVVSRVDAIRVSVYVTNSGARDALLFQNWDQSQHRGGFYLNIESVDGSSPDFRVRWASGQDFGGVPDVGPKRVKPGETAVFLGEFELVIDGYALTRQSRILVGYADREVNISPRQVHLRWRLNSKPQPLDKR